MIIGSFCKTIIDFSLKLTFYAVLEQWILLYLSPYISLADYSPIQVFWHTVTLSNRCWSPADEVYALY